MDRYERTVLTSLFILAVLLLGFVGLRAADPGISFSATADTEEVAPTVDDLYYEDLQVLDPIPQEYFRWARETVTCLQNRDRDLRPANLKFFTADTLALNGESLDGVYFPKRTIILREEYRMQPYIVKHEIVHAVCPNCDHDKRGFLPCTGRP